MVGDPFGIPIHRDGRRAADEGGKVIRAINTGRNGQHGAHRRGGIGSEDHRCPAIDHGSGEREGDINPGARQRNTQNHPVCGHGLEAGAGGMACRAYTFPGRCAPALRTITMHLPLRRRGQPVHRIDRGSSSPEHVRAVQHDAKRTADIGSYLEPGGDRLRPGAGGEHIIHGGLLEAVQQIAYRFIDTGDPRDSGRTRNDAHLICGVTGIVGLPQRITAPPTANVLVDHRHEVHRLAEGLAQVHEERHIGGMQQHCAGVGVAG